MKGYCATLKLTDLGHFWYIWGNIKKSQISLRTPERTTSLFYSYKQDTHTDIAHYIFRFMYRYTVLLYTTCKFELYFCEHNSHKKSTHKHTDITLYTPPVPHFVLTSAHTFLGTVILKTLGIHTLLGSIVQLYSHIVIQSVYTCILSLLVHTLCLAQL